MKAGLPWPGEDNPIKQIRYQLITGYDGEGRAVFKQGVIEDALELKRAQDILAPLDPHPAELAAKPTGQVDIKLAQGEIVIRPIYHRPNDLYRDLFKVDNDDCFMPATFAQMLERWRRD